MSLELTKLKEEKRANMRRIKILEKIILSNTEESIESLKHRNIEYSKLTKYMISQILNKNSDLILE